MTRRGTMDYLPAAFTALALTVTAGIFAMQMRAFSKAVRGWAEQDLEGKAELAAANLAEVLRGADFQKLHRFGNECASDGMRLTVFSSQGGLVYDSAENGSEIPDSIYATAKSGEYGVRMGLPLARVYAPLRAARWGFIFAALAGGAGVLLVMLFTYRQRVRMQELMKVEQLRRDFIADASHEIRTPLAGIIGAVELLAENDADGEMRRKLTAMIGKEAKRLNELASGILTLAKLERKTEAKGEEGECDVSEVLLDAAELYRGMAEEKGMQIKLAGCDERHVAQGSVKLLAQAVGNLVANAIRHSGSPDIELRAASANGRVRIEVEDHGRGIPNEEKDRVFERFYRIDASRSDDTGGSGLGLAIVKRTIEGMGGKITLADAENGGCRFTIFLRGGKKAVGQTATFFMA